MVGTDIKARGTFSPTASGSLTSSFVVVGTVPPDFRPDAAWGLGASSNLGPALQGNLAALTGAIAVRTNAGSTAITTSTAISIAGNVWTVD